MLNIHRHESMSWSGRIKLLIKQILERTHTHTHTGYEMDKWNSGYIQKNPKISKQKGWGIGPNSAGKSTYVSAILVYGGKILSLPWFCITKTLLTRTTFRVFRSFAIISIPSLYSQTQSLNVKALYLSILLSNEYKV